EKTFDISVDSENENTRLAGKTVTFAVSVKDVKAKELPELDDYFATTVGSYADLAALRSEVVDQLRARAELGARRELEEQVLDEAVQGSTLELPDKLLDYQTERSLHRVRDQL